ncbi:MAG: ABC transporter permease [Planctomycetes bacterium]|nr:ABC transporter permease [Planctomycetota bacterium]
MRLAIYKPWRWAHRVPLVVAAEMDTLLHRLYRARHTLIAVTRVEFHKKYAGSILGALWYPLYSAILLGIYCFVYLAIMSMKIPEMGSYEYVLFIFAGLIPFLGFSDALMSGITSIKSNIALVKNAVFPVELIPIKHILVSMAGLTITLAVLIVMILPTSMLGAHMLYLPVPLLLLFLFTLAVVWVLAAVAVLVPDLTYLVNLLVLMLMFLSPIGFSLDRIPGNAAVVLYFNPMTYLIESFRYALIGLRTTPMWWDAAFGLVSIVGVSFAGAFFRRLMPMFSDYE